MAEPASDEALIEAIKRGDESALAELYARYSALMMGVACRLLANQRDAEDLLHDVFLEAWQKAATFDAARGSVRAWLMIRLRSRASDRRRNLATARDKAVLLQPGEPGDHHDEVFDLAQQARATQMLETLDTDHREVIALAYFEGLSTADIAARCNVPVGTVKSRMSRAMARLRDAANANAEHV